MRRGQSTLEYSYIIGILAVAIIAALAYLSRGLQGRIRSASDQVGAGFYDPRNTHVNNFEVKHATGTVISSSSSTTTYLAAGDTTTSSSINEDKGMIEVRKTTDEVLGNLKNDTWH